MSRIGNKPITIPSGVDVKIDGSSVVVTGPKGQMSDSFDRRINIGQSDGALLVERTSDENKIKAFHGLTRSLLSNMVTGVHEGFEKDLELVGIGYRVQQSGKGITLNVMLSHSVTVQPPAGVTLQVEDNNRIKVSGVDKQAVGQLAAEIRKVRPPNIYTGKGIRYAGEQVRLKPGKSARRV